MKKIYVESEVLVNIPITAKVKFIINADEDVDGKVIVKAINRFSQKKNYSKADIQIDEVDIIGGCQDDNYHLATMIEDAMILSPFKINDFSVVDVK